MWCRAGGLGSVSACLCLGRVQRWSVRLRFGPWSLAGLGLVQVRLVCFPGNVDSLRGGGVPLYPWPPVRNGTGGLKGVMSGILRGLHNVCGGY